MVGEAELNGVPQTCGPHSGDPALHRGARGPNPSSSSGGAAAGSYLHAHAVSSGGLDRRPGPSRRPFRLVRPWSGFYPWLGNVFFSFVPRTAQWHSITVDRGFRSRHLSATFIRTWRNQFAASSSALSSVGASSTVAVTYVRLSNVNFINRRQ